MGSSVIVTGSGGFIGQYVVERLVKEGFYVVGIDRNEKSIEKSKFIKKRVNICNKNEVKKVFECRSDIEGIVHLAADIDMKGTDKTIQTNCVGTYYLAQCAVEKGMKYFINISSIPIIGKPIDVPITEDHPINPKTLYHITKFAAEKIVENVCSGHMRFLNYRISSPIGVNMNRKKFLSVIMEKCITGQMIEVYGQGMRKQNYIDVRDISRAVLCGIRNGSASGLFLIAGNSEISNLSLVKMCKEITHSEAEIVVTEILDDEEEYNWQISLEKARRELKYIPEYSLRETIMWIYKKMKEE